MDIEHQLDFYLDHLEDLVPRVVAADDPERTSIVAENIAREFGFVRRYVDAASDYGAPAGDEPYLPDGAEARLDAIAERLGEMGLADYLSAPEALVAHLSDISEAVFRAHIEGTLAEGELGPDGEPAAFPSMQAERADASRDLIEEADEVLSVARTQQQLGADLPAPLFARAVDIARRLRDALPADLLAFVQKRVERQAAARLLDVDRYGQYLWTAFRAPETIPMMMRRAARKQRIFVVDPREVLGGDEFEEYLGDGSEPTAPESSAFSGALARSESPRLRADSDDLARFLEDYGASGIVPVPRWDGPGQLVLLQWGDAFEVVLAVVADADVEEPTLAVETGDGSQQPLGWVSHEIEGLRIWMADERVEPGDYPSPVRLRVACDSSQLDIELPDSEE